MACAVGEHAGCNGYKGGCGCHCNDKKPPLLLVISTPTEKDPYLTAEVLITGSEVGDPVKTKSLQELLDSPKILPPTIMTEEELKEQEEKRILHDWANTNKSPLPDQELLEVPAAEVELHTTQGQSDTSGTTVAPDPGKGEAEDGGPPDESSPSASLFPWPPGGHLSIKYQVQQMRRDLGPHSVTSVIEEGLIVDGHVHRPTPRDSTPRPKTRADCIGGPRPCPYVGCKWNIYLSVDPDGRIAFAFPNVKPWDLAETCTLDVIDTNSSGLTLDETGAVMNITRERVRQLVFGIKAKLRKEVEKENMDEADLAFLE